MGFQSSFNQALSVFAGAALGKRHVEGQRESLAEQKMQGQFNVEREVNREQEQQEVADYNQQNGTAYIDKNEMMAARAGQALASETNSKKGTYQAVRDKKRNQWVVNYIGWYEINKGEGNIVRDSMSDEAHQALVDRRKFKEEGGNK